jgi:hypothetical protein
VNSGNLPCSFTGYTTFDFISFGAIADFEILGAQLRSIDQLMGYTRTAFKTIEA